MQAVNHTAAIKYVVSCYVIQDFSRSPITLKWVFKHSSTQHKLAKSYKIIHLSLNFYEKINNHSYSFYHHIYIHIFCWKFYNFYLEVYFVFLVIVLLISNIDWTYLFNHIYLFLQQKLLEIRNNEYKLNFDPTDENNVCVYATKFDVRFYYYYHQELLLAQWFACEN